MEICFIIASYLSLKCLIMASYMRHRWIWWRILDTAITWPKIIQTSLFWNPQDFRTSWFLILMHDASLAENLTKTRVHFLSALTKGGRKDSWETIQFLKSNNAQSSCFDALNMISCFHDLWFYVFNVFIKLKTECR